MEEEIEIKEKFPAEDFQIQKLRNCQVQKFDVSKEPVTSSGNPLQRFFQESGRFHQFPKRIQEVSETEHRGKKIKHTQKTQYMARVMQGNDPSDEIEEIKEDFQEKIEIPEIVIGAFSKTLERSVKNKFEFFVSVSLVDHKFGVDVVECEVKRADKDSGIKEGTKAVALFNSRIADKKVDIVKGQDFRFICPSKAFNIGFKMPFSDYSNHILIVEAAYACN